MASVFHLFLSANHITHSIIRESSRLERPTKIRHFAALKIQRLFRGYVVRKEISMWNEKATVIQKHVRGWLLRWRLPGILLEFLYRIRMERYNVQATKIQALWKGFKVRRSMDISIADILRRRSELRQVNDDMQVKLKRMFEEMGKDGALVSPEVEGKLRRECKEWVLYILFKTHHLLRTEVTEGVYSNHNETRLSEIERWMKGIPMKNYMLELRRIYNGDVGRDTYRYIFEKKRHRALEDNYRRRDRTREVVESDESLILDKRGFDLYKKSRPPKYERKMLYEEKYSPGLQPDLRTFSEHSVDFDLFVKKVAEVEPDVPAYHVDFWQSHKCRFHYPSEYCRKM